MSIQQLTNIMTSFDAQLIEDKIMILNELDREAEEMIPPSLFGAGVGGAACESNAIQSGDISVPVRLEVMIQIH